jgi:hypothetical protein
LKVELLVLFVDWLCSTLSCIIVVSSIRSIDLIRRSSADYKCSCRTVLALVVKETTLILTEHNQSIIIIIIIIIVVVVVVVVFIVVTC